MSHSRFSGDKPLPRTLAQFLSPKQAEAVKNEMSQDPDRVRRFLYAIPGFWARSLDKVKQNFVELTLASEVYHFYKDKMKKTNCDTRFCYRGVERAAKEMGWNVRETIKDPEEFEDYTKAQMKDRMVDLLSQIIYIRNQFSDFDNSTAFIDRICDEIIDEYRMENGLPRFKDAEKVM